MISPFSTGVTRVSGEDARSFLQSLVSSDLDVLSVGSSQRSLLLTNVGKVVACLWIYAASDDDFLIVNEAPLQEVVQSTLQRLCIRTKATLENVSAQYAAVVSSDDGDDFLLEDNHCGVSGEKLFLTATAEPLSTSDEYETFRIIHGSVSVVSDLGDETIPQEAGLAVESVSFAKGCFLGQELVCRIDSRSASTPHSFFAIHADSEIVSGSIVRSAENEIGVVTSESGATGIARISRKGAVGIAESHAEGIDIVDPNGNAISCTKIELVRGDFRC